MRNLGTMGLAAAAAIALLSCEAAPPPPPPTPAPTPTARTTRPPQPTMAQPAWGERVALEMGKTIDISAVPEKPVTEMMAQAETMLLSMRPGDEKAVRPILVAIWKRAQDDQTRATALAFLAVSLVYEPTVEGYLERLTDAYGLAQYAGSIDTSATNNHAARAIVANAAGATRQGQDMVAMIKRVPRMPDASKPWLALARAAANERGQAFFDDAEEALKARPDAWRVRAALVDRLVDLGFGEGAIAAANAVDDAPPALRIAGARAQVDSGHAADAVQTLVIADAALAGVDEAGRSEVIFWLAQAKLRTGDNVGAQAAAATLEARPGWQREAALLAAALALVDERVDDAAAKLAPLVKGTPVSTVLVERHIGLLAMMVAAEKKDVAGVDKAARFFRVVDVDSASVDAAKARAARSDDSTMKGADLWKAASAPTARELAARRALATGAKNLAAIAISAATKNPMSREGRALLVAIAGTPDEKARAAELALQGDGPALAERDLLVVIDALGAAPTKTGAEQLKRLAKGASPAVEKAVIRAQEDLANPSLRAKREAEQKKDDGHDGHDGHTDHLGPKP